MATSRWKRLLALTLALAADGCRCGTNVKTVPPQVAISPDALDFGLAPVGQVTTLPLVLTALGTTPVTVTGLSVEGDGKAAFTIEQPAPAAIDPHSTAIVNVDFAPPTADVFAAVLVVGTDDPMNPSTRVALSGTGAIPKLSIVPASAKLSARACPAASTASVCHDSASIAVANAGQVRLDLTKLALVLPAPAGAASGLSLANMPSLAPLLPGDSVTITFVYRPTAPGDAMANFEVKSTDPSQPDVLVPLTLHADPTLPPSACLSVVQVTRRKYVCTKDSTGNESCTTQPETVSPMEWGDPHAPRVRPGSTVFLTADQGDPGCPAPHTASVDPQGDKLAYAFALTGRPPESRAGLQQSSAPSGRPATAYQQVEIDAAGTYAVGLTVTDTVSLSGTDALIIDAIPRDDISVELQWGPQPGQQDTTVGIDLDLHLLGPGGALWSCLDCFWANPNPAWGGAGSSPDQSPRLLRDDIGTGPRLEDIVLTQAKPGGTYTVVVYYFNDAKKPAVPTLVVRTCPPPAGGGLCTPSAPVTIVPAAGTSLTAQGQLWKGATIQWPVAAGGTPTVTDLNAPAPSGNDTYPGGVTGTCGP